MQTITSQEFRTLLKRPVYGCFLFFGDEDYMKRYCLGALEKQLLPDETAALFDFSRIAADDPAFSPDRLVGACQTLPLAAEKRLIELHSLDFTAMTEGQLKALCAALSEITGIAAGGEAGQQEETNAPPPDEGFVLVLYAMRGEFDGGPANRPSAMLRALSRYLVPVRFDFEQPARLSAWVQKHFFARGTAASPEQCRMLIERCGRSMITLSNEIDKLCAYTRAHCPPPDAGANAGKAAKGASAGEDGSRQERIPGPPPATPSGMPLLTDAAIELLTPQNEDFDAFALSNAIMEGRTSDALSVVNEQKKRRERPELILGGISRTIADLYAAAVAGADGVPVKDFAAAMKMHEYKAGLCFRAARRIGLDALTDALGRCAETDIAVKTGGGDPYARIETLICSII